MNSNTDDEEKQDFQATAVACFTLINHTARKLFNLTPNDYTVIDSIRVLGTIEPESNGWCYASKRYLADFADISEPTVYRTLTKAESMGLLERKTETLQNGKKIGYTRTTAKFNKAALLKRNMFLKKPDYQNDSLDTEAIKMIDPDYQNDSLPSVTQTIKMIDNKDSLIKTKDNNNSCVVLFTSVFNTKIPNSLLDNPNLEKCAEYMVNLENRKEIEKPLAYLRSILKTPDEIPETPKKPEINHPGSYRRDDYYYQTMDREQARKDAEKHIPELKKVVDG